MNTLIQRCLLFTAVLALGTACSMKDRGQAYGIRVQLPQSTQQSLAKANLFDMASTSFSTPTAISGMQCFALNITGAGLQADPRFGCKKSDQSMGLIAGMAPIAGGTVDAMVPAGPSRLIQLIGLQSTVGCPSFETLLNSLNPNDPSKGGLDGIGDPYLLGSATIDVYGDTSVNIHAAFDPNKKLFDGCGDGDGGAKTLTFQTIGNSTTNYIQGQTCAQISLEAHNVSSAEVSLLPAVKPVVKSTMGTGTVELYTDSSCSTGGLYTGATYLSFPSGGQNLPLYVKTTGAGLTGMTLQVSTTATGWETPEVSYQVAALRLQMALPSPAPPVPASTPATCGAFVFFQSDASNTLTAINSTDTFSFQIYNNSGTATPSIEFYRTAADCSAQTNRLSPISQDSKSVRYDVQFTANSLYVRDTVAESISPSISTKPGGTPMQPAISGYSFLPFTIDFGATSNTYPVPLNGTGSPITLSFLNGTETKVDQLRINGQVIPYANLTRISKTIQFTAPAMTSTGTYALEIAGTDGIFLQSMIWMQYQP